jgi:hypothetical protein
MLMLMLLQLVPCRFSPAQHDLDDQVRISATRTVCDRKTRSLPLLVCFFACVPPADSSSIMTTTTPACDLRDCARTSHGGRLGWLSESAAPHVGQALESHVPHEKRSTRSCEGSPRGRLTRASGQTAESTKRVHPNRNRNLTRNSGQAWPGGMS